MWPEYIFVDRHLSADELSKTAASFFSIDAHDVIVIDDIFKVEGDYQCTFLYRPTKGDFVYLVEIFPAIPLQRQYPDSVLFLKYLCHTLDCCILMDNDNKYGESAYIWQMLHPDGNIKYILLDSKVLDPDCPEYIVISKVIE